MTIDAQLLQSACTMMRMQFESPRCSCNATMTKGEVSFISTQVRYLSFMYVSLLSKVLSLSSASIIYTKKNIRKCIALILFMEILGPKLCPKHNLEAHKICTNTVCFEEKDILVCPNCSSKHLSRQCEVIEVGLLNEKVIELMKKRVDFERAYEQACEQWLTELRKFKVFKEEITTALNARERALNQMCRKIRRNIPYEKDRLLFKRSLGCLFLSMRGINPNHQLYQKFNDTLAETISDCNRIIHRLRINHTEIPLFLRKQQQICAIISQNDPTLPSVPQIRWNEPVIAQFRKQTVKYTKAVQAERVDSKLLRLGDDEFLSHNVRSRVIGVYNTKNLAFQKPLLMPTQVEHVQVLGKNLFITNQHSNIFIYDLLNQRLLKEYTSSNHKQARITSLLALDRKLILNFVHEPNQIVALRFDDTAETLKVAKGVQTQAKALCSARLRDSIVASFDDHAIRIYSSQAFERVSKYDLQAMSARSLAVLDDQTLLAGGESPIVYHIDQRAQGIVGKFNIQATCHEIKKIYPTTVLLNLGNCLKLYQIRMQKQLTKVPLDSPIRHMEVLTSSSFVTSGKSLSFYQGIM